MNQERILFAVPKNKQLNLKNKVKSNHLQTTRFLNMESSFQLVELRRCILCVLDFDGSCTLGNLLEHLQARREPDEPSVTLDELCMLLHRYQCEWFSFSFQSNHNSNVYELNSDSIVKVLTSLKLCNSHLIAKAGCQREASCQGLHICRDYVLESCSQENCKFEHNFNSEHNILVLQKHAKQLGNFHFLDEDQLKTLLKCNRSDATMPQLCEQAESKCNRPGSHSCQKLHLSPELLTHSTQASQGYQYVHRVSSNDQMLLRKYGMTDVEKAVVEVTKVLEKSYISKYAMNTINLASTHNEKDLPKIKPHTNQSIMAMVQDVCKEVETFKHEPDDLQQLSAHCLDALFTPYDLDLKVAEEPFERADQLLEKVKRDEEEQPLFRFSSHITQAYIYASLPTGEEDIINLNEARRSAAQALEVANNDGQKYLALGMLVKTACMEGKFPDANQFLEEIKKLEIQDEQAAEVYLTMGYMLLLFHPSGFTRSVQMYAKACLLNPAPGRIWQGFGLAIGRAKRYTRNFDLSQQLEPLAFVQASQKYNWEDPMVIVCLIRWICEQYFPYRCMEYIRRSLEYCRMLDSFPQKEGKFLKQILQSLKTAEYRLSFTKERMKKNQLICTQVKKDLEWIAQKTASCLERASAVKPNDTYILLRRCQISQKQGNLEEAHALVVESLKNSRGIFTQAELLKVEIEVQREHLSKEEAIERFRLLEDRFQADPMALKRLAQRIEQWEHAE